ncbi:hypothetical protein TBLA_0J01530 [Henningerozyma blattae CBS 6284]|uniref:1-(5-phosphoribosyl)-5-[(5-phosphoribosylamino)methylideneamino] imidazole-4-carboxamide isomerase n=1 Tax=Henningerozyma blattae (strain ATCC 34711 / CBS 6284 / DSM 70876 / NBRC 10599 / NRRL Y-10934 / UCD 77-7) TaxID=1071380 RepID=I2H9U7_HENB6|nr:hypothetical protein TBLA_0J01530 [Tetrapisispora blattae CBS 6284]CCH63149.1 hypothetical protein TBLA_0J01530 [Tetrapisispora blattae CBS 6284]
MTRYIACIHLHNGQVDDIKDGNSMNNEKLITNINSAIYYVKLFAKYNCIGSHIIKLGDNNDALAQLVLKTVPNFFQIGGDINEFNCEYWLKWANKIIINTWLFNDDDEFSFKRLEKISNLVGRDKIVVDLSCRKIADGSWIVTKDKWQTLTDIELSEEFFNEISIYANEFLIHAADIEGMCKGIDENLVYHLYKWTRNLPMNQFKIVYGGGAHDITDLALVERLSQGRIDLSIGNSLDIFGGNLIILKNVANGIKIMKR